MKSIVAPDFITYCNFRRTSIGATNFGVLWLHFEPQISLISFSRGSGPPWMSYLKPNTSENTSLEVKVLDWLIHTQWLPSVWLPQRGGVVDSKGVAVLAYSIAIQLWTNTTDFENFLSWNLKQTLLVLAGSQHETNVWKSPATCAWKSPLSQTTHPPWGLRV